MENEKRNAYLEKIESNIAKYGNHIYLVLGSASPRFAYTIGLSQTLGAELVFAGSSFYSSDEVHRIINHIGKELKAKTFLSEVCIEIDTIGQFTLQNIDGSWAKKILLGALDFYNISEIPSLQILPGKAHWTIDIPNLSQPWSSASEPVWQWLGGKWEYSFSEQSVAVTNIDALQGKPVTEAVRWEEDEWELFAGAGPDVRKEDIRQVPLGTLLAWDKTLEPVINLKVGDGLWRDSTESEWQKWEMQK